MRLALAAFLLTATPAAAAELHYAPAENLEHIDASALGKATKTIDAAMYLLTDWPVIDALEDAGKRGVKVRIYVDGRQASQENMSPDSHFGALFTAPNVEIRMKHAGKPIQHLKSYCVDGQVFRTGSANFSASGLKQQDNDLLLFDDPTLCSAFTANFETIWTSSAAE